MSESRRKQMIVERFLEDERLRGDLTDAAARELLRWATGRAAAIAGDAARSDAEVDAEVQVLRRATLLAASSGEQEPARVVALAEAQLSALLKPQQASGTKPTQAAPRAPVTLSAEPHAQASAAEREVGAPAEQAAPLPTSRSLEPTLRRRRSRLAALLKRLREGR